MKKILITGVSGLIGSNLIDPITKSCFVYGISRNSKIQMSSLDKMEHIKIDLTENWGINALPGQIDGVIHLAQSDHFRDFPDFSESIFRVNTLSTIRLLDYARRAGASTFVLASSGGVYGYGENEFTEESEITSRGNLGFYLGTKLCSEVMAENYAGFMNIIILRFFFVYGPGQRQSMLIPRLVRSVIEGKEITLQGEDGIKLNPIYITDAVNAIIQTLNLTGIHKINIGGPEVLSLREIGNLIGSALNKTPIFSVQADFKPRHLIGDISKMALLLKSPSIHLKEGITQVIYDFRNNES